MSFFSSRPQFNQSAIFTVSEAQNHITAFNLNYELSADGSSNDCPNPNQKANWRFGIREGVINASGTPTELDFFYRVVAGGKPKPVESTDLYIKSNTDVDFNIYAQAAITANGPGLSVDFVMAQSMHYAGGKYSNVAVGGALYIYEDKQWVVVTDVDRTNDYAHVVSVEPRKIDYTVNIRAGKPMMFNAVQQVGGTSCPTPVSSWITDGYISKVQPLRNRTDWKIEKQLDKAYTDVLQFGIIWDRNGKKVDAWEYKEKQTQRETLLYRENLEFFTGQKVTNPSVLATIDAQFPGYEGYEPSVRYGGGIVWEFGKSQGFNMISDFTPLMLRQDSKKRITEYIGMGGLNFQLNMEDNNIDNIKDFSGACTFETFKWSGTPDADMREGLIKKGVNSWKRGPFSIHWAVMSALSDRRSIGNGDYPHMAFLMPGTGLTDSNGNSVPVMEWFQPRGWEAYKEVDRDFEKIDGCEFVGGHMIRTTMVAIHNPDAHIILQPKTY